MPTLEEEVAGLTQAATDLLDAVNVKKATLDQKVDDAAAQADIATTKAAEAETHKNTASDHATTATTKANEAAASAGDAAAVVTGGTGTLTPEAGKLPIAGAGTTINPAWLDQIPSRAQFEAAAANRRNQFAGSGFAEWGYTDAPLSNKINEGLNSAPTLANTAGMPWWGGTVTKGPRCHVNGYVVNVVAVNRNTTKENGLLFPPAPATADLLDRQDLVFLETWHEDVSEKDFVYPFGNVQFIATGYFPPGGASIVTVVPTAANFAGHDTYSLFGNWQAAGALIGRGMKYSTMTAVQRQKFLSDPENNCYLDGEKVIQVRYRIRVVQGPASGSWQYVNPNNTATSSGSDANILSHAAFLYVLPKGKKTNIAGAVNGDIGASTAVGTYRSFVMQNGTWSARNGADSQDTTVAHAGLCFALPIALVQRRNQGAYHPVWNPNGTRLSKDTTADGGVYWYNAKSGLASTADCFTLRGYTDNLVGAYTSSGNIGTTSSRPDGLFYDEINERDVLDLRNSAHKQADLKRTLEREFNKLVAGTTRGWEKSISIHSCVFGASTGTNSGSEKFANVGAATVAKTIIGDVVYTLQNRPYTVTRKAGDFIFFQETENGNFIGSGSTTVVVAKRLLASKTLLHCDIIGDPANYPQSWKDNGVAGTPLLVAENGVTSLIPDGTSKTFKMSRKVKQWLLSLRTTDNGVTWTTTTLFNTVGNAANSEAVAATVASVYLVFYLTEASPLALATNAEVLALGDATAMCSSYTDTGVGLVQHLTAKIPVATAAPFAINGLSSNNYRVQSSGLLSANPASLPQHPAISGLPNGSPAAKALPYLTRANGKLYLQALYKEMRHNGSSWGDDNKFNVVDNESTTTDLNAQTIKVGQKRLELPYFIEDGG